MAKDYFEEIAPEEPERHSNRDYSDDDGTTIPIKKMSDERGIRNVQINRATPQRRSTTPEAREQRPRRRRSGGVLWTLALLAVLVLGGLFLFAMRPTSVTVTPKTQIASLTDTATFVAYPTGSGSSTLTYSVERFDLQDSVLLDSTGTSSIPGAKASGNITVYNNYSATEQKLVKNTRFQSAGGHIFRAPSDIVIPGKSASGPGQVKVTVVADQEGSQYNVAAGKFTLPGLKSNAAMYAGIYAESSAGMTGGASAHEGPGIKPSELTAAQASLRGSLATKALSQIPTDKGLVLKDLMQVTYEEAQVPEGDKVRFTQKAHVEIPVIPGPALAAAIAGVVAADTEDQSIRIHDTSALVAHPTSQNQALGTYPLSFTLSGKAELIWEVDARAVQEALKGRDAAAFQSVVATFLSISEAHAKIQPFWKNTFPSDPSDIHITIIEPSKES